MLTSWTGGQLSGNTGWFALVSGQLSGDSGYLPLAPGATRRHATGQLSRPPDQLSGLTGHPAEPPGELSGRPSRPAGRPSRSSRRPARLEGSPTRPEGRPTHPDGRPSEPDGPGAPRRGSVAARRRPGAAPRRGLVARRRGLDDARRPGAGTRGRAILMYASAGEVPEVCVFAPTGRRGVATGGASRSDAEPVDGMRADDVCPGGAEGLNDHAMMHDSSAPAGAGFIQRDLSTGCVGEAPTPPFHGLCIAQSSDAPPVATALDPSGVAGEVPEGRHAPLASADQHAHGAEVRRG